jgi:hypothetical protein
MAASRPVRGAAQLDPATKSSRPDQPERRLAETARLRKPQALSGLDHL